MAIFLAESWVNPFGNISIFRLFEFLVFIIKTRNSKSIKNCQEKRFFVVEYGQIHFPGLYCLNKKDGKMASI